MHRARAAVAASRAEALSHRVKCEVWLLIMGRMSTYAKDDKMHAIHWPVLACVLFGLKKFTNLSESPNLLVLKLSSQFPILSKPSEKLPCKITSKDLLSVDTKGSTMYRWKSHNVTQGAA